MNGHQPIPINYLKYKCVNIFVCHFIGDPLD